MSVIESFDQVFIANNARTLDFVVYISGVRTPAISVSVTNGQWAFPQATITVPPDSAFSGLGSEDRAHVCIFYWDSWATPSKPQYRLLFDGEIFNWSYNKSSSQKDITFQAIGWPFVFTQFFFEFVTSVYEQFLSELTEGATQTHMFEIPQTLSTKFFTNGFIGKEPLKAPIEFLQQAVELLSRQAADINGVEGDSTDNIRAFFTSYVAAWNMLSRMGTYGIDASGFNILSELQNFKNFDELYKNFTESEAQSISGQLMEGSIWDFIVFFFKAFFHEVYMFTTPKEGSMKDMLTKPQTYFTIPPKCNVVFPSMILNWSYSEDYWAQPTRTIMRDVPLAVSYMGGNGDDVGKTIASLLGIFASGFPAVTEKANEVRNNSANFKSLRSLNSTLSTEELNRGPVSLNIETDKFLRWTYEKFMQNASEEGTSTNEFDAYRQSWCDYQHELNRALGRTGSVTTIFNPYIVHSSPVIFFDDLRDRINMMAYVQSVTHVLSVGSAYTQISVTGFTPMKGGDYESVIFMPGIGALAKDNAAGDGVLAGVFGGNANLKKLTVNGKYPKFEAAYHTEDIVGESQTKSHKPSLTELGHNCFSSTDYAMENYVSRPIQTLEKYAGFYGAPLYWKDPIREQEYKLGLPRPPDVLAPSIDGALGKDGIKHLLQNPTNRRNLPWTRSTKARQWSEKMLTVLDKASQFGKTEFNK